MLISVSITFKDTLVKPCWMLARQGAANSGQDCDYLKMARRAMPAGA
jgi:hypothetical protein